MSDNSLTDLVSGLPDSGLTVRLLKTLDYLVPGEWTNPTTLEALIRDETEEDDQEVVDAIGVRAIELFMDPETGYQRAVSIFSAVDNASTLAGLASLTAKAGEDVEWLSFLSSVTPKAETTQTMDAGLKLAADLMAFCSTNGLPGDSVGEFASAVMSAMKEDKMRLASWAALDCVLPLGPNFMTIILDRVHNATEGDLMENSLFTRLTEYLPGGSLLAQKQAITDNLEATSQPIEELVAAQGIEQQGVLEKLRGYLNVTESRLDYIAATIDLTTSPFEHTGIQSVARRAIARAYGEI